MGDMVAAFVGFEQRGIGVASEVGKTILGGFYAFLMMVYSIKHFWRNTFLNIIVLQLMKCLVLKI